jgi:hypothetical protein
MTIIFNADTGISTPGLTNSGSETVSGTLQVGSITTNLYPLVSGTAVASTSGTSIDFTGIPAYAKRITVMFNGVSTSGTSVIQIQIGSTTFTTSGYSSTGLTTQTTTLNSTTYTSGFGLSQNNTAAAVYTGVITLVLQTSNTWVGNGNGQSIGANSTWFTFGFAPNLAGALDRVRITTVNGTDTFDAGSINIMWE